MTQLAKSLAAPIAAHADPAAGRDTDSLFEQIDWLYILYREKIFRDDTARLVQALWQNGRPTRGAKLVELGCGPGFYSRGLAARFPELEVHGLDRSRRQLKYAREKATGLTNCRFEVGDVLDQTRPAENYDYVVASRLFTVLREPQRAVAEMFRILNPSGRCFIAEPRFRPWASIPLFMMWMAASISGRAERCREPGMAQVLTQDKFEGLFRTQPWRHVQVWQDGRYQYALCEKG